MSEGDALNRELANQADQSKREKQDDADRDRSADERGESKGESDTSGRDDADLKGLGQAGTSKPQPGIAEHQGGGIDDAIGGGQSGQGGG